MTSATDNTKAAAALSGPPQRPRADKSNLPKPPGATPAQPEQKTAPRQPQPEPQPVASPPAPTPVAAPSASRARQRLAARNAEQTFLPLVSRVAKLREWVEQAELAVQDAIAMGVDRAQLEDVLRSIARKNEVPFEDIPESVRRAVSSA